MTDHESQLMSLRAVTATTGAVHEAQLLQLKMWGALAFAHLGAGRWRAQINVEDRLVSYHIERDRHPKELAKLIASLDSSIHWLFGPEWATRVVEKDKVLYQGRRVSKSKNAERRARQAKS